MTLDPKSESGISDLDQLLRSMSPKRNGGVYVFVLVPRDADVAKLGAIATFRENEGLSVIVEESRAAELGSPILFRAAWITLTVISDLHAVGLTAAVAGALADKGISCNVVAAANHDHLFVPVESADAAMAALEKLGTGSDRSL